ncbi:MAG: 4Fe-4S binding protein [Spirochaetota bacterium]
MKNTKKKITVVRIMRIVSELLFLSLFLFLVKEGSLQKWFLIFGAGVVISLIFGRLYCGWVCPVHTLFRFVRWMYEKIDIKRFSPPALMNKGWIRYLFLGIFVALVILVKVFSLKLNVLLYITGVGFFLTLLFEEELWHNRICPFGTILSISSKPSLFKMKVLEDRCTGCGRCTKVCPAKAISASNQTENCTIDKSRCLICFRCQEACSAGAIGYRISQ